MSVNIFYNNQDFFSDNNLSTPNVSRSASSIIFGEKRGNKETIVLSGVAHLETAPTDCDYLTSLNSLRDSLINFFSNDYKEILIKEDGVEIFKRDFCEIKNIQIPTSGYKKTFEYEITIEAYDEVIHNEFFGIESPKSSISIQKTEGEIYTITRNISAKGVNTQDGNLAGANTTKKSSAMENAIDFVKSKIEEDIESPDGSGSLSVILIERSETINRVQNIYEIQETFISDKNTSNSSSNGVLRYVISKNKNFGDVHTVSVSGDLKFDIDGDIENLRNRFKQINFFEEISSKIDMTDFVQRFNSIEVSEDINNKIINFQINYDNDKTFDECGISEKINHTITEYGNMVDVSISGTIESKGPKSKRWNLVKDYFYNKTYDSSNYSSWINQASQENLNENYTGINLYKYPENKSIKEDKKNGVINFEYSFSNRDKIEDFKNFQCNISVNMPTPRYSVDMNFGGGMDSYIVSRSGFSKGSVQVSVSGVYKNFTGNKVNDRASALALIKSKAEDKINEVVTNYFSSYESVTIRDSHSYKNESNTISYQETREFFKEIIK